MLPRLVLRSALAVLIGSASGAAQTVQPDTYDVPPAHVSHVEGTVSLEREGRPESSPLNMPLLSGDRLKTVDGRVEVLFGDGSALHMDARTTIDVQSDELLRLIDGRVRLNIAGPARVVAYRIDSPAGSVRIAQPGEYRVSLLRGLEETQLELAVLRGGAEIFTDQGSTPVRAGERAYASAGLAPSYAYAYNSATWDAFDRWSEARRDARLGVSAQYLPEDIRTYASTFDEYGDWRYQQAYGYVWYPRVAVGWRPYYYGRWAPYPRYGWTWIGVDGFAWPTHHWGRWGFSAGAWFWIPSSRWAPAYVSWAYAPGYVSWCPLGFDNRPVISVNVFSVGPGYYSSSRAWTAVTYSHFGREYWVHQRALNWGRLDRAPRFQLAGRAPAYRDVAVPRNSTPIQRAGSRGLPPDGSTAPQGGSYGNSRTGTASPRYTNRGDTIVRSRTERPTAPRPGGSAAGSAYAVPRTAPDGPVRQIAPERVDPRAYNPRAGYPTAVPRASDPRSAPDRAVPRIYSPGAGYPRAVPRGAEPGSAPERIDPRSYNPRVGYPRAVPRGSEPVSAPERVGPRSYNPRPEYPAAVPRAPEPRGGAPAYQPRASDPRADSPGSRQRYEPPSQPPARAVPRGTPPPAPAGSGSAARGRGRGL
jgi:hypothetical protein